MPNTVQERRLKWYRHVMKGDVHKRVMDVAGMRGKGRPKQRWMDRIKND